MLECIWISPSISAEEAKLSYPPVLIRRHDGLFVYYRDGDGLIDYTYVNQVHAGAHLHRHGLTLLIADTDIVLMPREEFERISQIAPEFPDRQRVA